jgi:hypothetical protein
MKAADLILILRKKAICWLIAMDRDVSDGGMGAW